MVREKYTAPRYLAQCRSTGRLLIGARVDSAARSLSNASRRGAANDARLYVAGIAYFIMLVVCLVMRFIVSLHMEKQFRQGALVPCDS
jgi:hypothetical protein